MAKLPALLIDSASETGETDVVRCSANTIDDVQKLLVGYRDNMRVEIETGVAVIAKTVADLRALSTWPDGLDLNIHVDLDPRLSVVRVERAS
jgi:L-aminopeptidase/D-esterase-like protein